MAFDEKKYFKYFEKESLSEEQKLERINIYKGILTHFVDAAFGQTPEQLCLGTSKEKYLQSLNVEVESRELSKNFRDENRGPLTRKPHSKNIKGESLNHAEPN